MKKTIKFLMMVVTITMLLCLALPVMAVTNTEGVTFTATINTPTIEVSDQDQTVEVTISTNKEVVYDSYEADVYLPSGFAIAQLKNTVATFVEDADYFENLIVYCTANAQNLTTDNLLTITYTIPANTPAGEYDLGVYFWIIGRDYCTDIWEEGADVTATLTITEPAPACEHKNVRYVCVSDSTHDVVCVDCDETTQAGVACTDAENDTDHTCDFCNNEAALEACTPNADDGDCTTAITCSVCDAEITAANNAHVADEDDDDCTTAVKCVNCEQNAIAAKDAHEAEEDDGDCTTAVNCVNCKQIVIEANATHIGGTATCTEKAKCSVCGTAYGDTDNGNHAYGTPVKDWYEIDGDWYYGDKSVCGNNVEHIEYTPVKGLQRVPYPTVAINGVTHAPNQEDIDYAANEGIEFIDATKAWFVFDENGVFQGDYTGIVDDNCYAVNGCVVWHAGLVEINDELYYFVGDTENGGNKLAQGDVWVTRTELATGLENGACYNFKDGKLSGQNGIVDGYYYENSRLMLGNGLTKVGDNYIYVRSTGKVVMDAQYYIPANDLGIVSTLYTFDENGFMVEPKSTDVNGVVDGYYYVDGKVAYGAGLIELDDGSIIYVRSNGELATGWYYVTNTNGMEGFNVGDKLDFGTDGIMKPIKNGVVDGYYYVNNHIQYGAGLIKLDDGSIIYVRSNGQVATGKYYVTNTNEMEGFEVGQKCYFDETGKLVTE